MNIYQRHFFNFGINNALFRPKKLNQTGTNQSKTMNILACLFPVRQTVCKCSRARHSKSCFRRSTVTRGKNAKKSLLNDFLYFPEASLTKVHNSRVEVQSSLSSTRFFLGGGQSPHFCFFSSTELAPHTFSFVKCVHLLLNHTLLIFL